MAWVVGRYICYYFRVAFFADLSPYTYYKTDGFSSFNSVGEEVGAVVYEPAYERVAVGWLDLDYPFATGPVPAGLPDALLDVIAAVEINVMLGFHPCQLCPESAGEVLPVIGHRGRQFRLGNGELRVPAKPGVMYAAPTLVVHYVTEHAYQPPLAFSEAVLAFDGSWFVTSNEWVPVDAERFIY